jgi:hypothetical protein
MRSIMRHHEDFHNLPLFRWAECRHRTPPLPLMTAYSIDRWSTVTAVFNESVR